MNENPYTASRLDDDDSPARSSREVAPGRWARRWWVLLLVAYAFPYACFLLVGAVEEFWKLRFTSGLDLTAYRLVTLAPFLLSLVGVALSLFIAPLRRSTRVGLFLATILAYPVGFLVMVYFIIMIFGFEAT